MMLIKDASLENYNFENAFHYVNLLSNFHNQHNVDVDINCSSSKMLSYESYISNDEMNLLFIWICFFKSRIIFLCLFNFCA